jgi:hypothetical protein
LEQEEKHTTTMNPTKNIILLLCVLLSHQTVATAASDLEKYMVPLSGGRGVAMFKAERLGLRSTGGSVPRNWDIFVVKENDEPEQQRLTNMQFSECGGLDVSPDGSNIVFSARVNKYPQDSFFALRLTAIQPIRSDEKRYIGGTVILDNGKHNLEPHFSPDGRHVLFLSQSRRPRTLGETLVPFRGTVHFLWEICVIDLQTRAVTVIDRSNEAITQHGYSNGGTSVLYTKDGRVCHLDVADIQANKNE